LSVFESPQEAVNAMRLFREHLSANGKVTARTSTQFGPDALVGEDPYQGKILVTHKGPYLIGAVGFEQDKEGERRLDEMLNQVK